MCCNLENVLKSPFEHYLVPIDNCSFFMPAVKNDILNFDSIIFAGIVLSLLSKWEYLWVVMIFECPSHFWISESGTPFLNNKVAQLCLKLCKRICLNPLVFNILLKVLST